LKLGLIADIHGNAVALDAIISELPSDLDHLVCLGDTVQGGTQPAEVMRRLRDLGCPVIMGNTDAWLLSGLAEDPAEPVNPEQRRVGEWTLSQLGSSDIEYMRGFVPTLELSIAADRTALCFHGTPRSFDELIFPETPQEEVLELLGTSEPVVLAGGHTHVQQIRCVGHGLFVNPGSVGVVYDRHQQGEEPVFDLWAEYAVVELAGGHVSVDFRRLPYALGDVVEAAEGSGRPHVDRFLRGYSGRG